MSINIIPISDLRRQTSRVIKTLREGSEVAYITQYGRPTAVLIEYEQYEAMAEQLETLADLASLKAAADEPERPYEEFLAEMNMSIDS